MHHDQAFLRAMLDRPEDDAVRLIFADWLEEQGDATQAEFIRVQVALARLGPVKLTTQGNPLFQRERELLREHWKTWIQAALPATLREVYLGGQVDVGPMGGIPCYALWSRGFVGEVKLNSLRFLRHAAALFTLSPVTEVAIENWPEPRTRRRHRMKQVYYWDTPLLGGAVEYAAQTLRGEQAGGMVSRAEHWRQCLGETVEGRVFPDALSAWEAISRGCVAFGRAQAGLPALPPVLTPKRQAGAKSGHQGVIAHD